MQIITVGVPDHVVRVAITILIGTRNPQQNLVVNDRNIDRAFKLLVVVIAEFTLNIALKVVSRLLGNKQDRAASRVTPEQGALRPVQNLKIFQVYEITGAALLRNGDRGRQGHFV